MSVTELHPAAYDTRCFHYRTLQNDGARFTEVDGCAIASTYGGTVEEESALARRMGLVDLSPLPRTGFKGRQALQWLTKEGLAVPVDNNVALFQDDGSLVARLADTEAIILSDLGRNSDICKRLDDTVASDGPASCYHVPRRNASAWFLLSGKFADAVLAKICGVDMRRDNFPVGMIAQTSMARMSAIGIRADVGGVPAYHLIFDSASADYLWGALKDAMTEFDGKPVGYDAIVKLVHERT